MSSKHSEYYSKYFRRAAVKALQSNATRKMTSRPFLPNCLEEWISLVLVDFELKEGPDVAEAELLLVLGIDDDDDDAADADVE